MNRYYIDQRKGCIAVRDKNLDNLEDDILWHGIPGVIKFWLFPLEPYFCPTCDQCITNIRPINNEMVKQAEKLCKELNEKELNNNE